MANTMATSTFLMKIRSFNQDLSLSDYYDRTVYTVVVPNNKIFLSIDNFPDLVIEDYLTDIMMEFENIYIACVFYLSSKHPYPTDIQVMVTGKTIGMHETDSEALLREVQEEIGNNLDLNNIVNATNHWRHIKPIDKKSEKEGKQRVAGFVILTEQEFNNIERVRAPAPMEQQDNIMAIGIISIPDLLNIVVRGSHRQEKKEQEQEKIRKSLDWKRTLVGRV